ncbi:MAG: hypothetical protein WC667_13040 [Sulfurimonas sp.]|jgi:hypothetical protein
MKTEKDVLESIQYLNEWVDSNQKLTPEIIKTIKNLDAEISLDKITKHNLVLAKHMAASEEFLQKMDNSFGEIITLLEKMQKEANALRRGENQNVSG